MNILNHIETVIHYAIDSEYFANHSKSITSTLSTASNWRREERDTYFLTYSIYYAAHESGSDDDFICYEGRLNLHCRDIDLKKDCFEIIGMKEAMHNSMRFFIEKNCFSCFDLLKFKEVDFTPEYAQYEKENLERLMQTKPFEEKSEQEKKFEKSFGNDSLKIRVPI